MLMLFNIFVCQPKNSSVNESEKVNRTRVNWSQLSVMGNIEMSGFVTAIQGSKYVSNSHIPVSENNFAVLCIKCLH